MDTTATPAKQERSLAWRSWGNGETVVALHGLADQAGVWGSLGTFLAERARLLAPDLPGHGESEGASDYSAAALAGDLERWAGALGLASVRVIAHSWAAKVALRWARQAPARVSALALVDPFFVNRLPAIFRPTLPVLYRTLPFLKAMGPFPDLQAAEALGRRLKQYRGWSDAQRDVFRASLVLDGGVWRGRFLREARDGVFEDMLRTDGLDADLDVPALLLLPEAGLNRAAWQTAPYRRHLRRLETRSVPGNHWPHLVEPGPFHAAIERWLDA